MRISISRLWAYPPSPPQYRGRGVPVVLFISPLYSGGLGPQLPPLYSGRAWGGAWTTAVVSTNREM